MPCGLLQNIDELGHGLLPMCRTPQAHYQQKQRMSYPLGGQ